jgi:hypothetical protein
VPGRRELGLINWSGSVRPQVALAEQVTHVREVYSSAFLPSAKKKKKRKENDKASLESGNCEAMESIAYTGPLKIGRL